MISGCLFGENGCGNVLLLIEMPKFVTNFMNRSTRGNDHNNFCRDGLMALMNRKVG